MNNKKEKYSIRKLTIGCASCLIGLFLTQSIPTQAVNITNNNNIVDYNNGTTKTQKVDVDSKVDELNTILNDYTVTHNKVVDKYSGGHISATDYTEEMVRLIKLKVDPTEAMKQAKEKAKSEKIDLLDMKDAYNNVYNNKQSIIQSILKNSKGDIQQNVDKIKAKPVEFMVGLAYIERLYNFDVGNIKAKDLLVNHIDYFKSNKNNNVDLILEIGSQNIDKINIVQNTNMYNDVIKKYTNINDIPTFLETVKPESKEINDWYKDTTKATVVEKASIEMPTYKYRLYDKLKATHQQYILPLLNVSENSIYAISNPTTITLGMTEAYEGNNVKNIIENIANKQTQFIDFWLRTAKPELKDKLNDTKLVIDTLAKHGDGEVRNRWAKRTGSESTKGIKEFLGPMGKWKQFLFVDGYADGNGGMSLFLTPALYDRGVTTYTHELTHIYDKTVFLDGYERRDGLGVEFFARGLLESYTNTTEPIYSINTAFPDKTDKDFVNKTPERFNTPKDIQDYMKGVLDFTYLLNGLEAKDILNRPNEAKLNWFKKHNQVPDSKERPNNVDATYRHTTDNFTFLDNADNLNTIDDLIDNNIVARRYNYKGYALDGTAKPNDYFVIPLFTPLYSAFANDNGVSGDITTRLMAFELLGEYGYHDGFVPFVSNKFKTSGKISDTDIYSHILREYNGDVKAFKKAMYEKRLDKEVKPVSIMFNNRVEKIRNKADIVDLLENAITLDLLNPPTESRTSENITLSNKKDNESNVDKLKSALFEGYKNLTDDFRVSIFKEDNEIIYVHSGNTNGDGSENNPMNNLDLALEKVKEGGTIIFKDSITINGDKPIVINKNVNIDGKGNSLYVRGHNIVMNNDVNMKNINLSMLRDGTLIIPTIYTGNNNVVFDNVTTTVSNGQKNERPNLVVGTKDVSNTDKVANVTFKNSTNETVFKNIEVGGTTPAEHTLTLDERVDSYEGININNNTSPYTINTKSKIERFVGTSKDTGNLVVDSNSLKMYVFENINNVVVKHRIQANKVAGVSSLTVEDELTLTTPTEIDSINGNGKVVIPVFDVEEDMNTPLTVTTVAENTTIEFPVSGLLNDSSNGSRFISTPNTINNVNILREGFKLVKTDVGYVLRNANSKITIEIFVDENNDGEYDGDEFKKSIDLDYIDNNYSSYIEKINKLLEADNLTLKKDTEWEHNDGNTYMVFVVSEQVGEVTVETDEVLEASVEYIADPNMNKGERRDVSPGSNGLNKIKTKYKTINGEKTDTVIGNPEVRTINSPTNKVIAIGVKETEQVTSEINTVYVADDTKDKGIDDNTTVSGVVNVDEIVYNYEVVRGTGELINKKEVSRKNKTKGKPTVIKVPTKEIEDVITNDIKYLPDDRKEVGYVETLKGEPTKKVVTYYWTVNPKNGEYVDRVPVNTIVEKNGTSDIVIKGTKPLEEKEVIAYETEYRADNEKSYGDNTETGGVDGERTYTTTYKLDTTSGKITTSKNAGEVTKQPENKIITKGTKPLIEELDIDPEIKYVYLSDKPSTFKEELPGKKGLKRKTTNYILDTTTGNIEVVVGSFEIIKESTPTIIKLGTNNDTSIDYSVQYEADYSREYGTPNIVIQEGKKGVINSNGEVVTKPENKIISVGAKSNSTITPIEFETIRKEVTYLKLGEVAEVTEGKDGYEKVTNSYIVDENTGEVTISTNREIKKAVAKVIEVGIGESKVPDYNLENEDKPEFNLETKVPDYNLENEDKPEFNLETKVPDYNLENEDKPKAEIKVPDYNLENEDKPEFNLETKVPNYNLENEDKPEFNLETKVPDYNLENEDKPEFNLETKVPNYNLENEDKPTISAEEISEKTSKKDKLPATGLNSVAVIYGLVPLFGAYLLNRRKNQ